MPSERMGQNARRKCRSVMCEGPSQRPGYSLLYRLVRHISQDRFRTLAVSVSVTRDAGCRTVNCRRECRGAVRCRFEICPDRKFNRRGCVFAPISDQIEQQFTRDRRDSADVMQLLRRLVAHIEDAGSAGVRLTPEHELFHAAKQTLTVTSAGRTSAHRSCTALHDLVWRVDCVRSVRSKTVMTPSLSEALDFLETSDIHRFLRQEP